MVKAYFRGHLAYLDVSNKGQCWRYCDTKEPVDDRRVCAKCGELPTPEGHDACLGYIEGALWACCGHGVQDGYVKYGGE